MAITSADEAVIERRLNERYVLVPRDPRRARWLSLGYAITALTLAEIVVVLLRCALAPICAKFELALSLVSKFAFGLWLPGILTFVILATVAKEFVPRLSHIAHTWNLVAYWVAGVAAALSAVGAALAGLSLMQSLS